MASRRLGRNSFACAIALALSFTAAPVRAESPPPIPAEWAEFLRYDREYNLRPGEYPRAPLPLAERAVVPLFHVDIPEGAEGLEVFRSRFLDGETAGRTLVRRGGRNYVRLFFVDRAEAARFGAPQQRYWATKMQSHASYFVWNPAAPSETPFVIKYPGYPDLSIANNDYVETHMGRHVMGEVMTERLAVRARAGATTVSYLIRSLDEVIRARRAGLSVLPLHGFLGSPDGVATAAGRLGLTERQWIEQEYLPKLARFLARQSFNHGVHIEAHTQNLLIRINPVSGRIDGFVFRDMQDVLPDTGMHVVGGRSPQTRDLRRLTGEDIWEVNRAFVENRFGVGDHFASYGSQAILEVGHRTVRERAAEIFIDEYIASVERITGVTVTLSATARGHLQRFRDADYDGVMRLGLGVIIQSVHDSVRTQLAQTRWSPSSMVATTASPTICRDVLSRHLTGRQVALLFPNAAARIREFLAGTRELRLVPDGRVGGLAVFDPGEGTVIAFAYDLLQPDRDALGIGRADVSCAPVLGGL